MEIEVFGHKAPISDEDWSRIQDLLGLAHSPVQVAKVAYITGYAAGMLAGVEAALARPKAAA